jgi:hypothetical protein
MLNSFFENPKSSRSALVWPWVTGVLIVASALIAFLEPLEMVKAGDLWFQLNLILSIFFSIELILRITVANAFGKQTRCGFMRQPLVICDFIAILAVFTDMLPKMGLLTSLRLLKIAQVARLGRLGRMHVIVGPITVIMAVVWGIYVMHLLEEE